VTLQGEFLAACAEELAAPKPGNVHVHADGHGMTVADFLRSAEAAAPALCAPGAKLGDRIFGAVAATRKAVAQNTNLGIVLLCAPLLMAAEAHEPDLKAGVRGVLQDADLADAEAVFAAIRLAAPGGLGDAPRNDVREPANVTLTVAMAEAAHRDSIARQWANGFPDVFGLGSGVYAAARRRWKEPEWAALAAFLEFLAAFPDSHVLRKHGAEEAERLRRDAGPVRERLWGAGEPFLFLPALLGWDQQLKQRGINPGTSADLTVATILAWRLSGAATGPNERG
jgi:triphosphoribosyl-dephospho-CoA synthase